MAIILENNPVPMETTITLDNVVKVDKWITDGSILIDSESIKVVFNQKSELNIGDDKKPIQKFIKKITSEKLLNDILKEENEVFNGSYALDYVRLMYNENIAELIGEDYFIELHTPEFRFFFYDDSFYLFADLQDYFFYDENEHVKLVGVLKKCESRHPRLIPHLLKLEEEYNNNLDNLRV